MRRRTARLHISMATAKTHIGRLLAKLAQLVIAAYQSGLINGARDT
jgi:hypothetical protein